MDVVGFVKNIKAHAQRGFLRQGRRTSMTSCNGHAMCSDCCKAQVNLESKGMGQPCDRELNTNS